MRGALNLALARHCRRQRSTQGAGSRLEVGLKVIPLRCLVLSGGADLLTRKSMTSAVRKYLQFDPAAGFPASQSIRYECGICGETVASIPENAATCKCRNLIVDADAGRFSVKNNSKIRAYEIDG